MSSPVRSETQSTAGTGDTNRSDGDRDRDQDGHDNGNNEGSSSDDNGNGDGNDNGATERTSNLGTPIYRFVPSISKDDEAWLPPHTIKVLPSVRALSLRNVKDRITVNIWLTGAPLLWRQGLTGAGVRVGVIDSGIDDSHPELRGKVVLRRDYANDGATPSQFYPHGTHLAGTIAANGPMLKGVAPDAVLLDYRISNRNDTFAKDTIIATAILDAIKDGCHILTLSFSSTTYSKMIHDAIKKAVDLGILVVASAGNAGLFWPRNVFLYPGALPEVFSVGSVDFNHRGDGSLLRAVYSYCGPSVDAVSTGTGIISAIPGGEYALGSGTSMATAHASGFAALLQQKASTYFAGEPVVVMGRPRLYIMLKSSTVDVRWIINPCLGAGLITAYPAAPVRDLTSREWYIPGFSDGKPPDEDLG